MGPLPPRPDRTWKRARRFRVAMGSAPRAVAHVEKHPTFARIGRPPRGYDRPPIVHARCTRRKAAGDGVPVAIAPGTLEDHLRATGGVHERGARPTAPSNRAKRLVVAVGVELFEARQAARGVKDAGKVSMRRHAPPPALDAEVLQRMRMPSGRRAMTSSTRFRHLRGHRERCRAAQERLDAASGKEPGTDRGCDVGRGELRVPLGLAAGRGGHRPCDAARVRPCRSSRRGSA